MSHGAVLLGAAVGLPLALLIACSLRRVRENLLPILPYVPLPALATALLAVDGAPLVLGHERLPLGFALDLPGAILLGVAALLWIAGGRYAATEMRSRPDSGRFVVCWLMTLAGCLGVYLAADMVSFYGLLALLSVGASCLIIQDGTPRARRAAAVYLGLALLAEAFMLLGFVLLAAITPDNSLWINDAAAALVDSPWRNAILALLVIGFGMKAGLVPAHFFMPLAYGSALIPVAAVVSGAVIKASILGLIRFLPYGIALPDWGMALAVIGLFGALYGVVVGITQTHPKTVLAYSSVSQMGFIVAIIGMGIAGADAGARLVAAFYAANHVLVKGSLFLAVGVIAATGRRQLRPTLALVAVLALGLGGLPLTGGALAKSVAKETMGDGLASTVATVSSIASTLLMLHFLRRLGKSAAGAPEARAPAGMAVPWLLMAMASMVIPWALYLAAPGRTLPDALAPYALWSALWPIAAGTLLAIGLARRGRRLPRIPEGDVSAVTLDFATRHAFAAGRRFGQLDAALRRWPVAATSLLFLALLFAAAIAA